APSPTIHWPSAKVRAAAVPGQVLEVRVTSPSRAKRASSSAVGSLIRLTHTGAPMRVVATRKAVAGVIKLTLPAASGGRYTLRVTGADRRSSRAVTAPWPAPPAPAVPLPPAPAAPAPTGDVGLAGSVSPCAAGTVSAVMAVDPAQAPP